MKPADIIYTPLDLPLPPKFDKEKLYNWIDLVHNNDVQWDIKTTYKNAVAETKFGEEYPWNLVFAYFNVYNHRLGWQEGFNNLFPELATYMYSVYGLREELLGQISLLPIKSTSNGIGFWHNDVDRYGLRVYLDFEDSENNSLLIKKTVEPYDSYRNLGTSKEYNWMPGYLQEEIYTAKIMHPNQCFYLNNLRSVHTTYVKKPSKRIAAFISGRPDTNEEIWKITEDLIIRSAEKFKDYAIFY